MHGSHKRHARLSGADHPNFKHGMDTLDALATRKKVFEELDQAFLIANLVIALNQKES